MTKFNIFKYQYFSTVLVIFLGCTSHPSKEQLYDKYGWCRPSYKDTIIINRDGSYTHRLEVGDKLYEGKNNWEFRSFWNYILFNNFSFTNDTGYGKPHGTWISRTQLTSDGEVKLMYSSEDDLYYSKK